jgi:hypothetical protein
MASARRSDLRTEPWAGEGEGGLMVYDPTSDTGYLLNPATAAVFEKCDGTASPEEMARLVADRTGLPADTGIVALALEELSASGLLLAAPVTDAAVSGIGRRALIGRLALGAGAVVLLPFVDVVGGVSRLAAVSNTPAGGIPPLIAQDKSAATTPGVPVAVTLGATGGFSDPDVELAFRIETVPGNGTVDLVGAVATYTPAAGFTGTDSFTYIAWQCVAFVDAPSLACPDGTGPVPADGTAPATVTITVTEPTPTTEATTTTAPAAEAVAVTNAPRFTG